MTVAGQLDTFRASHEECSLVVFGDLFSQVTLCISSDEKHPQEYYDALCVSAGNMFDGPVAQFASAAIAVPTANTMAQAVVFCPTHIHLFLRSAVDPADVLCCVLSLNADLKVVCEQAQAALLAIAHSQ